MEFVAPDHTGHKLDIQAVSYLACSVRKVINLQKYLLNLSQSIYLHLVRRNRMEQFILTL